MFSAPRPDAGPVRKRPNSRAHAPGIGRCARTVTSCGLQGCPITGLPNYRVAQLQGCPITGLPNYRVAQLQGCPITGLPNCRVAQLQGCPIAGLPNCRVAQLQGCPIAGLPNCRVAHFTTGPNYGLTERQVAGAPGAGATPWQQQWSGAGLALPAVASREYGGRAGNRPRRSGPSIGARRGRQTS